VSTAEVDMWQAVKIWMKNLIEVPTEFLSLIQVLLVIQNKTQVLNLKWLNRVFNPHFEYKLEWYKNR
jgi:hypothetical protein